MKRSSNEMASGQKSVEKLQEECKKLKTELEEKERQLKDAMNITQLECWLAWLNNPNRSPELAAKLKGNVSIFVMSNDDIRRERSNGTQNYRYPLLFKMDWSAGKTIVKFVGNNQFRGPIDVIVEDYVWVNSMKDKGIDFVYYVHILLLDMCRYVFDKSLCQSDDVGVICDYLLSYSFLYNRLVKELIVGERPWMTMIKRFMKSLTVGEYMAISPNAKKEAIDYYEEEMGLKTELVNEFVIFGVFVGMLTNEKDLEMAEVLRTSMNKDVTN